MFWCCKIKVTDYFKGGFTMPSMFEALSQLGSYALDPPKTMHMGGVFSRDLPKYVQKVASDYLNYDISLNTSIAKIASENGLNEEQTQRIITEANNQVYMTKFASLKDLTDRRVDFDLATKEGVKEALNPKKIEKTASVKNDKLNFFNYTPEYCCAPLSSEKKSDFTKIAMRNINSRLGELENGIQKEAMSIYDNIDSACYALLRYEECQKGLAQEAFDEMCKTASIGPKEQVLYKNMMSKKASEFASNINSDIITCDIYKKEHDYSLGNYTMNKVASEKKYPTIKTDGGTVVNGISGLVKLASDTSKRLLSLNELIKTKNELEQEVKDTLDNK